MQYKIIYKNSESLFNCLDYIEKEVAMLIKKGWVPQGGISVATESEGYSKYYTLTQAMIKHEV